ncbi:MAG: flagellar FliJ family protein [Alphaproteobacteria bacterium]
MTKALKTLVRVKKNAIDELRKTLGNFFDVEAQLVDALKILEQTFLKEKEIAKNIGPSYDFGLYTKFYIEKRSELNNALLEIKKQIDILQERITEEFKEQKTFEIVDENRLKATLKEEELKTQKMLDEIATNSYIRRNSNV